MVQAKKFRSLFCNYLKNARKDEKVSPILDIPSRSCSIAFVVPAVDQVASGDIWRLFTQLEMECGAGN